MGKFHFTDSTQKSSLSLLAKAHFSEVKNIPFPHLIIKNALDEDLYQELSQNYPKTDLIRQGKNIPNRHQLTAKSALAHDSIHSIWKQFISYQTSQTFYLELLSFFESHISSTYPWLEESLGKNLSEFSCGVRDSEEISLPDICFDCQPGLNTIHQERFSVRSPHLDARNKLITGLFYMKYDHDKSEGGDLQLYQFTNKSPRFTNSSTPDTQDIKISTTIPYQRNTAVFFMNTPHSVHGVSEREGTDIPRRLVNLIAGVYTLKEKELYPEPKNQIRKRNFLSRFFQSNRFWK